jgi:hypothetical protein
VLPDFARREKSYSLLRTRIRNGIKNGPNFAGHLVVVEIGCGAGCRVVPVADVRTGRIYDFPLGGEDNQSLTLKFRPTSRLIVAFWHNGERCLRDTFLWTGTTFVRQSQVDIGPRDRCFEVAQGG